MADTSYLHEWNHGDYEVAKDHIYKQLGDISGEIDVFGRKVLVAVYVRPSENPNTKVHAPPQLQMEDVIQGKTVLILMCGPSAFDGDDEYLASMYPGGKPPGPGEWVFLNSVEGTPMSIYGAGAERVTIEVPSRREGEAPDQVPLYPFKGWQCRIIEDDSILGRIKTPNMVV